MHPLSTCLKRLLSKYKNIYPSYPKTYRNALCRICGNINKYNNDGDIRQRFLKTSK